MEKLGKPRLLDGTSKPQGLRDSAVAVVHSLSISSSSVSDLCLRVTVAACVWMALWAWGIGPKCGQLTKPSASPGCCLLSFWYCAVSREQSSMEQAGTVPPTDRFPLRSQGSEISGIYG